MKKNSFIEGTIIASLAIIITKILGVLYVIPFYSIIGEDGGILYSYAYNIYNLFLNISTAGIPIAISMIVSEYLSLEMDDARLRTYNISKKVIFTISLIAFLILFIFADGFAMFFLHGVEGGNSIKDVALVIRAISFCLLITPFLSVLRGFLQGHKFISPTSISQVVEQIIRIAVILLGSYISINIFKKSIPIGVAIALTGAFFGGLFAYFYLKFKVNKDKSLFAPAKKKDEITNKEIIKKIITYAIPLIITSIISNIYDLIDMKLVIKGLYMIGYDANTSELISSIIATWGPKICMIIIAISMGLTTSLIPHLVNNYVKNQMQAVNTKFNQAISTILVITIPMATGLYILAEPVYTLFYGESYYGPLILKYLAILNIFTGVLTVINTSLQGLKRFKIIYLNSIVGLAINTILDIPLILLFNKIGIYPFYGTITATIIGCSVSYIIVFIYLHKQFKFNYKPIFKALSKIIIPLISMIAILLLLKLILPYNNDNNLLSIVYLIIMVGIAAFVYLFILYKNKGLDDVFGKEYIDEKLKKLHLKK